MNDDIFTKEELEEAIAEDRRGRTVSFCLLSMIGLSVISILVLLSCV